MMKSNRSCYLVAGLGKTGQSIARYLQRKNVSFVAYDTRTMPKELDSFRHEFKNVTIYLNEFPDTLFDELLAIICSPGVPLDTLLLQEAKKRNIPIYGDIECLAKEVQTDIVAITGTNGKSTVTTLVGDMAAAAGINVAVAGNIGSPVLDILAENIPYQLWVLELSSFQLDLTHSLSPTAATILNITNDHLDRHHTMESYIAAKQRIYHSADTMVYNRADMNTKPLASMITKSTRLVSFGLDKPEEGHWGILTEDKRIFLAYGSEKIISTEELKIKGLHNWENALSACALAEAVGIEIRYMVDVLRQFCGLPHRAQWVRTINGVDWINDSKGTNIGATSSAILGIGDVMQGKLVLIAGGQGKGADFAELREPIAKHVRLLVLIGEDADRMEQALGTIVTTFRAASLEAAVQYAKQQAQPGDVVMLSPACASFDMFRDFNDRGEKFVSAVESL